MLIWIGYFLLIFFITKRWCLFVWVLVHVYVSVAEQIPVYLCRSPVSELEKHHTSWCDADLLKGKSNTASSSTCRGFLFLIYLL